LPQQVLLKDALLLGDQEEHMRAIPFTVVEGREGLPHHVLERLFIPAERAQAQLHHRKAAAAVAQRDLVALAAQQAPQRAEMAIMVWVELEALKILPDQMEANTALATGQAAVVVAQKGGPAGQVRAVREAYMAQGQAALP